MIRLSLQVFHLQLKATGGVNYQWSPATGLNNPNIQGPVAMLDGNPEFVTYMVTVTDQAGCLDTASITSRFLKPDLRFLCRQVLHQMVMDEMMYSGRYMLE